MSVTCSVSLVDWPEFVRVAGAAKDSSALAQRFPPEPISDDISGRQLDFLERLDAFATAWDSSAREAFTALFNTLFWSWRSYEHRLIDLDVPIERLSDGLESAWSPATVKRFAGLWRQVSLEECRDIYRPAEGEYVAFTTFEEFKEYAEEWGGIIERGAARGLGLVTFAWG